MTASNPAGITRARALATVQLRPPKRATANVYGTRSVAPTSVGIATSVKSCDVEKWKPALFRLTAVTLHSTQTEKARNSAKIENVMLRRATLLPWASQNASSSGVQCSIHGLDTLGPPLCDVGDAGSRLPVSTFGRAIAGP